MDKVLDTSLSSRDLKEVGLAISAVGVLVGVVGLYYRFGFNNSDNDSVDNSDNNNDNNNTPTIVQKKSKTKLDTLD